MFKKISVFIFSLVVLSVASAVEVTPKLVKLSKGKQIIYLFGSVHLGAKEFYPLPDYVTKPFQGSTAVAVEMDITEPKIVANLQAIIVKNGFFTDGKVLSNYVDEQVIVKLKPELPPGFSQIIEFYRPWVLVIMLVEKFIHASHYDPKYGIDVVMLNAAKKQKKPIIQLETPAEQMSVFIDIPDAKMGKTVEAMLDQLPYASEEIEKTVTMWRNGDEVRAKKYLQEERSKLNNDQFFDKLFTQRNKRFAQRIALNNHNYSPLFVVIGAGHIYGDEAIQRTLLELGYKVD